MTGADAIQVLFPADVPLDQQERLRRYYLTSLRGIEGGPWGRLPRIYAEALLAAADSQQLAPAVADDLDALLQEVFPNVEGLEAFLASPAVSRRRKDELIVQLFEGKATPLFVDFLRLLNNKDRLGLLRPAVLAYWTLLEQRAGRRRVVVESAAPLENGSVQALADALRPLVQGTPVLLVRLRPELIGGVIVRIGDRVFDTSIRTRLHSFCHQLLARGSHEIQNRRDRFCLA
ncbi:MAG: ATP synthase F1 subunit delta [Gemmataceae bacterium]|nr:ATP synthase F1 subunit delta [Gemmataceae bacterium]MCS7270534.1 ATP synthase F1 subunit delta [Gemmataceae bacterium]MDW8242050.1 ATP synthase F1 subunit delta [Thermogemmata sp.]